MQRHALRLCFWSGPCLISLSKRSLTIYPHASEDQYTGSLESFSIFAADAFSLSSLGTFYFEFFCFFFFIWPNAAMGHLLRSDPNWKGLMSRLMCRAYWQSHRVRILYFNPPHKARNCLGRRSWSRISWKSPRHRGWIYISITINVVGIFNSLAILDLARSRVISHRRSPLWTKVWSPTCTLNGSFQSPNCQLKAIFISQTGVLS